MKHALTCIEPVGLGWDWKPCGEIATHRVIVEGMPRSSGIRCTAHAADWEDVLESTGLDERWIVTPLHLEQAVSA